MKLANEQIGRRGFLAGSAAASLVIGFNLYPAGARAAAAASAAGKNFAPNAFLRVASDGTVTVLSKHLEMGQGTYTGLATIVAEELDADWSKVRAEGAPADAKLYANHLFGMQGTGGSSSIANSWDELRAAGATARAMLIQVAATAWNVPAGEIETSKSTLRHAASNRSAPYAQFVAAAAALPSVPAGVKPKDPATYSLIGKSAPRLDSNAKTDGTAQFTLDVYLPGMLTAMLARSPKFGGTVKSFDAAAAKKVKGVIDVVQVPNGVAVIGKDTWAAKQGREALNVTWDFANAETRSTSTIIDDYKKLAQTPGAVAAKKGDAAQALSSAAKRVNATYVFPYLAHAPMEPMDAVVKLTAAGCEIWTGDQFQTIDQANAAKAAGLKPEQVTIHTLYAGGSFGRRANAGSDFIVEAVSIAKAMKQKVPVKLVWTREDDVRGGLYRPLFVHKMEAGIDAQGNVTAWTNRAVGQSIMSGTPFEAMMKGGIDPTSVEGSADMPYDVPNVQVDVHNAKAGVPVLWWRSVGHTHTAFAVETFLDDVAKAAGKDPLELRRSLMTDAKHARLKHVLELVAEKAEWSKPLAAGPAGTQRGRGIAAAESFSTLVAQVAEVTVKPDGTFKVDRVVVAVDCGVAVNPDVIKAQMEGGVGFGLGALLHGEITLKDGEVEQSNFHDYVPLRMDEMPKVEVHIVPSTVAPTGVGEPGVPPVGPAVANAIFAATGKRVRELPLTPEKLKAAIASA